MIDLSLKLPEKYLQRMESLLGTEFAHFAQCYALPAENGLRVNTLKISPAVHKQLSSFALQAIPWCPAGYRLEAAPPPSNFSPGKHPLHAAGLYYLQDPSAMAAAEILAPQPGDKVLDLAAAPGGKTTHLAALMNNEGLLVANEIHPKRVWTLAENLERCGVRNAAVLQETPQRLAVHFNNFFDRVMVDAPCSGEGMFRKSPEARQAWSVELVQSCAARQISILRSAAEMVRPGGFLLYSTCTFAPEENEAVVNAFLNLSGPPGFCFEIVNIKSFSNYHSGQIKWIGDEAQPIQHLERAVRFWPHHQAGEGHFFALLQRQGRSSVTSRNNYPIQLKEPVRILAKQFFQDNFNLELPMRQLTIQGSYLYLIPDELPSLQGLKVIHPGWWVAVAHKNRLEPSHALAMGLKPENVRRNVGFLMDSPQVQAYLHGESLRIDGADGWTLISIHHAETNLSFSLGWGKHSQGMLKNSYPRGLRWI